MKRLELLKEIRSTNSKELIDRIARLEKELVHLCLKKEMKQLKSPLKIRAIRKEIAIIKTIQVENKLGEKNG